jgi:hypothetical protein
MLSRVSALFCARFPAAARGVGAAFDADPAPRLDDGRAAAFEVCFDAVPAAVFDDDDFDDAFDDAFDDGLAARFSGEPEVRGSAIGTGPAAGDAARRKKHECAHD